MIKTLLWDLDNTLLDFPAAERQAIQQAFAAFRLGPCPEDRVARYAALNDRYWKRLERGEITKAQLLTQRFVEFFQAEGIAGPDPAPHRPSVPIRLVVLGLAVTAHSVLCQLLYAGWHVTLAAPSTQLQQAAELMYYGGDISEMILAFAMVSTWHPARPTTPIAAHRPAPPAR